LSINESSVEIDRFSACPGCGGIGHTVQEWVHRDGEAIQMMHCSEDDCRVDSYYPEVLE